MPRRRSAARPPAPAHPEQPPPARRPGDDPAHHPGDRPPARPSAPTRQRGALAGLASMPPDPVTLVPPANTARPQCRNCPGQLVNGPAGASAPIRGGRPGARRASPWCCAGARDCRCWSCPASPWCDGSSGVSAPGGSPASRRGCLCSLVAADHGAGDCGCWISGRWSPGRTRRRAAARGRCRGWGRPSRRPPVNGGGPGERPKLRPGEVCWSRCRTRRTRPASHGAGWDEAASGEPCVVGDLGERRRGREE